MNDVTSVLEGPEADNIYFAQQFLKGAFSGFDSTFQMPKEMLIKNYEEVGFDLFLLRLPGVLLLILALLGFFWWGKKLFGKATILLTLLIVSSTFLIIPASKFVADDVWLLAFQLMSFTSLILLLKQPIWRWRILFWIFTILGILVNPISALVFSFGMYLFLVIAHPNGKKMLSVWDVLFGLIILSAVYFLKGFEVYSSRSFFHYFNTTPRDYFLAHLIGVLPWFAFLPAGIIDIIQKLRKREELAIISIAFLFFSIMSYGLILQVAFAFLIAKQLENYFKPNYPYTNLVKSFVVLNLFFSFALVSALLLAGYDTFGVIGFRSRMGTGGVYWAFGFLAVIGLFGNNRKMIIGGMALSGSLSMLLFWTQISPLLENYRDLPEKLAIAIDSLSSGTKSQVYFHESFYIDGSLSKRQEIYLNNKNIDSRPLYEIDSLKRETRIFVLEEDAYSKLDSIFVNNLEIIQVDGRNRIFETEQKIWILKK